MKIPFFFSLPPCPEPSDPPLNLEDFEEYWRQRQAAFEQWSADVDRIIARRNRMTLISTIILIPILFGLSISAWHLHLRTLAILDGVLVVVNLNTLRICVNTLNAASRVQIRTR